MGDRSNPAGKPDRHDSRGRFISHGFAGRPVPLPARHPPRRRAVTLLSHQISLLSILLCQSRTVRPLARHRKVTLPVVAAPDPATSYMDLLCCPVCRSRLSFEEATGLAEQLI